MYKKVNTQANYNELENEVLDFWKANNIKQLCLDLNKDKKIFSFYEGPPTANGTPHMGHVLTRALKDVITRFKSMDGYFVPRKGGWDTHGLAVELGVEKEIGISGKQEIEEYGTAKFIDKCKQSVTKYIDLWKEFSNRIAYNVNMDDDCYFTYDNEYIESEWWALSELYKKGWLYKGYKIMPSCPKCGTALSSHEVAQGYETQTDKTITVKFRCDKLGCYILAWTTTPWTLPSNIALCVNAKEDYVLLEAADTDKTIQKFVLAKALINSYFEDYKVSKEFKGSDLVGLSYIPLFDFATSEEKENGFKIVANDYVTLTDGTGIVHIAPAFGEDDARVGRENNLPFLQMVDKYGKFKAQTKELAGKFVFDENENIIKQLIQDKKALKVFKHTHEYPHCWRCASPLMYYARDSWFIKSTAYKDKLIANNQKVNWIPSHVKNGRMGNFYENIIDWGVSRDRIWGTPLNIWGCECGHYKAVSSIKELKELGNIKENVEVELHKPFVDEITFKCEKCGKIMKRESEVIDAWFDSGAMPFAQHHYPFENKKIFESRFPADFISEGIDQTRGWFYTMQNISTALFNKTPYKNCQANGFAVDQFGKKLSKHLGNYEDPIKVINEYGADSVRFNLYAVNQPYNNIDASSKSVAEYQSKFISTLYNTYAFYCLYAEIDNFDPNSATLLNCTVMDKWILSKLNSLTEEVNKHLNNYESTDAARKVMDFVDILSNWYVRRSRKRFWSSEMTENKLAAYSTLFTVLSQLSKLIAPFVPFISESIYQNIERPFFENSEISVHLCSYPKQNKKFINKDLEEEMALTYKFCELARSARNLSNIKIRQPLGVLYLTDSSKQAKLDEDMKEILRDELNIKNVVLKDGLDEFVDYNLKPQLKTLGPKYGKVIGKIRELLERNAKQVLFDIKEKNKYVTTIDGILVELREEDLLTSVSAREGFITTVEGSYAAVLDGTITPELYKEGVVRELISKIQNLRKTSGLNVVDRIEVQVNGNKEIVDIILEQKEKICPEVLALSLIEGKAGEFKDELEVNGKVVKFAILKSK